MTARFLAALGLGIVAMTFAPSNRPWWLRAVVGWDVGALGLTLLAWLVIWRADAKQTQLRAASYDPGRAAVFVLAVAASAFSLFAATVVMHEVKTLPPSEASTWSLLSLGAVAASWLLTHTAFTLRYAHLYYRRQVQGGLEFPGGKPPSDIDFAYFSFTVGMCAQTSDVVVSSSRIRRAVLFHALLSFVYNTTILALALNLVIGLVG